MSEVINNISFSERQYMLKVVDFIDSLIIKCNYDANLNETVETKRDGNAYVLAKLQKKMDDLGLVNMNAIKSYDEQIARKAELDEKIEVLTKERINIENVELKRIISELEEKIKAIH